MYRARRGRRCVLPGRYARAGPGADSGYRAGNRGRCRPGDFAGPASARGGAKRSRLRSLGPRMQAVAAIHLEEDRPGEPSAHDVPDHWRAALACRQRRSGCGLEGLQLLKLKLDTIGPSIACALCARRGPTHASSSTPTRGSHCHCCRSAYPSSPDAGSNSSSNPCRAVRTRPSRACREKFPSARRELSASGRPR